MLRGRTPKPEPPPERPAPRAETYLDQGCELVGELRFRERVRIDGRVEGEIRAAKEVVVGESGAVLAGIEAESVEVYGSVEGDIQARSQVTLHKSARVSGEIQTAGIVVEPGARFKGAILIGAEDPPAASAGPSPGRAPEADGAGAQESPPAR